MCWAIRNDKKTFFNPKTPVYVSCDVCAIAIAIAMPWRVVLFSPDVYPNRWDYEESSMR